MTPTLPRLNNAQLPRLEAHLLGVPLGEPDIGIVHLGLGNFHRAHQALYTEQAMLAAGGDWAICGVTMRGDTNLQDILRKQDNLYSVLTREGEGETVQVVRAVREVLVAPVQQGELLALLRSPQVRIVSITVTEKGYCHNPVTGGLDLNHPAIRHDLANPDHPESVPGYLVAALRVRRENPFTVLSCDNLPHNGELLRRVVLQYAAVLDAELATWIAETVCFPCTMVDRIVPATTDEDRAAVAHTLQCVDAWPVPGEAFRQWVIEDTFSLGRPAWERVGATLVADVTPYEQAKLRMLNGAHSSMAYLSALAGFETVDQAIEDPDMHGLIHAMMTEEIIPTLTVPADFDVLAYRDALLKRFGNAALKHKCMQIAADGSLKLPPRLLGTIAERLAAGASCRRLILAVAAWMRFLLCCADTGRIYEINDPRAAQLSTLATQSGGINQSLMDGLLALRDIFPASLADNPVFRTELSQALHRLAICGSRDTMKLYG